MKEGNKSLNAASLWFPHQKLDAFQRHAILRKEANRIAFSTCLSLGRSRSAPAPRAFKYVAGSLVIIS